VTIHGGRSFTFGIIREDETSVSLQQHSIDIPARLPKQSGVQVVLDVFYSNQLSLLFGFPGFRLGFVYRIASLSNLSYF
jgi:hypothetical protein